MKKQFLQIVRPLSVAAFLLVAIPASSQDRRITGVQPPPPPPPSSQSISLVEAALLVASSLLLVPGTVYLLLQDDK